MLSLSVLLRDAPTGVSSACLGANNSYFLKTRALILSSEQLTALPGADIQGGQGQHRPGLPFLLPEVLAPSVASGMGLYSQGAEDLVWLLLPPAESSPDAFSHHATRRGNKLLLELGL